MSTHAVWVHPLDAATAFNRDTQPAYMELCLPFRMLQCMARLRTGSAMLEVQGGMSANLGTSVCVACAHVVTPLWLAGLCGRRVCMPALALMTT